MTFVFWIYDLMAYIADFDKGFALLTLSRDFCLVYLDKCFALLTLGKGGCLIHPVQHICLGNM